MAKGFLSALKGVDAFGKVSSLTFVLPWSVDSRAHRPQTMSKLRLGLAPF